MALFWISLSPSLTDVTILLIIRNRVNVITIL